MKLIGRYRSPFVRRAGVVLKTVGLAFETEALATTDDTEKIRSYNPVGRVPSLVLDSGETLVDSQTIIDYALEIGDPEYRLLARSGHERWAVLNLSAIAQGTMEKAVASVYERTRRPKEKVYQGWVDMVEGQITSGLAALESHATGAGDWMHGDHMTLADINAVVAYDQVRFAEPYLLDARPCSALAALSERCNETPPFAETRWKD
jgi:glutathione S-transferase